MASSDWLASDWDTAGDAYPSLPEILKHGHSRNAMKKMKRALADDPLLKVVRLQPAGASGEGGRAGEMHRRAREGLAPALRALGWKMCLASTSRLILALETSCLVRNQ